MNEWVRVDHEGRPHAKKHIEGGLKNEKQTQAAHLINHITTIPLPSRAHTCWEKQELSKRHFEKPRNKNRFVKGRDPNAPTIARSGIGANYDPSRADASRA